MRPGLNAAPHNPATPHPYNLQNARQRTESFYGHFSQKRMEMSLGAMRMADSAIVPRRRFSDNRMMDIKIDWDFCSSAVWVRSRRARGWCCDTRYQAVPISPTLLERMDAWIAFRETYDPPAPWAKENWAQANVEGLAIAMELKNELGEGHRVYYGDGEVALL